MAYEDLGFFSQPPQCVALDLGNDYVSGAFQGAVVRQLQSLLGQLVDPRYVAALEDATFYCKLKKFILYDAIIDNWMFYVANNLAKVVLASSAIFVTLWVVTTGMKMMSGMYREPFSVVMLQGAKMVLVFSLISVLTGKVDTVIHTVLGLQQAITTIVTGSDQSVERLIDMNLAVGQFATMVAEDVRDSATDQSTQRGSSSFFAGALGQTGPAVLTSILVMVSQLAIAFALMLAPLFVFFLLFKSTAGMFWGWLKFLFVTVLGLACLSIISTIAMSSTLTYGFLTGFSRLMNDMADGTGASATLAQAAIKIILEDPLGAVGTVLGVGEQTRVDLSGTNTNLATMSSLFAVLIVATPALIMQLFNLSTGYASNLMGAIGVPRAGVGQGSQAAGSAASAGGGGQGASGASGANGASGARGADTGQEGGGFSASQANNRHAMQSIAQKQRSDEFNGGGGNALPYNGNGATNIGLAGGNSNLGSGQYGQAPVRALRVQGDQAPAALAAPTGASSANPASQWGREARQEGSSNYNSAGSTAVATNASRNLSNANVQDATPKYETPRGNAPSTGGSGGGGTNQAAQQTSDDSARAARNNADPRARPAMPVSTRYGTRE